MSASEAVVSLRSLGERYHQAITPSLASAGDRASLFQRPSAEVWSVAEYLGHIVEALLFIAARASLIIQENDPVLPRFGDPNSRDHAATDVELALVSISEITSAMAYQLEAVDGPSWNRVGHNELGSSTLLDAATYAVHEGLHHLGDIQRQRDPAGL